MLDLILKYLPLLVFVAPFLAWLDKAKRFSHRRKFYVERLEAAQTYIDKYHNKPLSDFEKDCAAQALVGSEKIGYKKVDYVIEHCAHRFFFMADKLATANNLIDAKEENGRVILAVKSSKLQLRKEQLLMVVIYFSSLPVLYANNIALYIISKIKFFNLLHVSELTYLIGFIISFCIAITIAILSGRHFLNIDAALEIHDELNIQHRP